MITIKIDGYDDAGKPVEITFGWVIIECETPFCKKSFNAAGSRVKENVLAFSEPAVQRSGDITSFSNPHGATCPYCGKETKYYYKISMCNEHIALMGLSENVVAFSAMTPDGEIKYIRNHDDLTDDPNFNFTANINSDSPAYFYNDDDEQGGVTVLDAHFIKEGHSCIATLVPNEEGMTADIIINGPLAVLKQAILIISNRGYFVCEEVVDEETGIIIAPNGPPAFFKDKVVVCREGSPRWTRLLQSTGGPIDG